MTKEGIEVRISMQSSFTQAIHLKDILFKIYLMKMTLKTFKLILNLNLLSSKKLMKRRNGFL